MKKTLFYFAFCSICTIFAADMEKRDINDVLRRNVAQLSKIGEKEASMMPAIEAPLPSVEQVKQIVTLVKSIIFPDYFNKRQPDEAIRSYYIGVHMEELMTLLTKQIAHGLQFCEDCKEIHTKAQVYAEAERLATQLSTLCRRSSGCSIPM